MTSSCDVHQHPEEVKEYAVADAITTSSEMADSGLGTGSISPHENTTSENSSADLEVTRATEYTPTNDNNLDRLRDERGCNKEGDCKKLLVDDEHYESLNNGDYRGVTQSSSHSVTYSSLEAEHQPVVSSENALKGKLNAEEIFQYESRVLSEPFYESDCGSDENESFEFVESVPSASGDCEPTAVKYKSDQKVQSDGAESTGKTGKTSETEFERHRPVDAISHNNSSTSGYYFIDASTLNDEVVDIVPTNVTKNHYQCNNYANSRPASHFAFFSDYTTNSKSNSSSEDQSCKFTPLKTPTLQCTGHERVAEFERELKLTECLHPLPESRKVKRADSASEEKVVEPRPADKESLAVEIKEADSGESAHPSPCPDNNTKISNDRDEKTKETSSSSEATADNGNEKDANANEDRRPSLIRRNTFELDSNDEKLSVLRQEYERRQGSLVFQSSIPQYSGHRVDGDSLCSAPSDTVAPPVTTEPTSVTYTSNIQITANTQYPVSYLLLDNCKYEVDPTQQRESHVQDNLKRPCAVYPVTKSASDKSIIDYGADSDDASNRCSSSLPVTLDSILEKDNNRVESVKRNKRDEATPIISGGVSTSDYSKPTDSPTVRRKTESTPIVSGGSVIMNKPEVKAKPARMSSSMTAWVVDMSDCNKNDSKSRGNLRNMSQSFSTSECVKKPARKSNNNNEKHHCSLGFFVNLKDVPAERDRSDERKKEQCSNGNKSDGKPYCEFYVDISGGSSNGVKAKPAEKQEVRVKNGTSNEGEKKNIFSMFIDLNDTSETSSGDAVAPTHRRSFSTVVNKADTSRTDDSSSRDNSSAAGDNQSPQEQNKEKAKPSPVFMFIESDSPVVRRRTLSTSRPAFKRHSWNVDKTQPASNGCVAKELMFRREHKRAHSISIDNRGDSNRSQAKTSSSSHSLSDAAKAEPYIHKNSKLLLQEREHNSNNMDTSSEDVFEFDVRDTPPNSHVEIESEELRVSVASRREYKEITAGQTENLLEASEAKAYDDEFSETSAWEKTCTESTEGQTRKSETFDISSGSGPSPDSDNHEYELADLLNGEVPVVNDRSQIVTTTGSNKISETRKSLNETIKKIECELKEPEYNNEEAQTYDCRPSKKDEKTPGRNSKSLHLDTDKTSCSSFVRLSDLDKTPIVNHASDVLTMTDDRSTYRMSSSIPETSWIESKLAVTRNSGPVRPVSRKLASVMSTSLPSKQKSPLEDLTGDCEGEGIISESDLSSMQSSMGRSGAGT